MSLIDSHETTQIGMAILTSLFALAARRGASRTPVAWRLMAALGAALGAAASTISAIHAVADDKRPLAILFAVSAGFLAWAAWDLINGGRPPRHRRRVPTKIRVRAGRLVAVPVTTMAALAGGTARRATIARGGVPARWSPAPPSLERPGRRQHPGAW